MMDDWNSKSYLDHVGACEIQNSAFQHLSKMCHSSSFSLSYLNIHFFITFYRPEVITEVSEFSGISNSVREEESSIGGFSALRNVGKPTKDGILGTASAPIHMVAAEGGNFKEQLWRTIRSVVVVFLLVSGVGALIEDKGISKGIAMSL